MTTYSLLTFFNMDPLAVIVISLVSFIGVIVSLFAVRHMEGDSRYACFFWQLAGLVLSVIGMVVADNLLTFLAAWGISNALLVRLMIHKSSWQAAANAGWLAGKAFVVGFVCLAIAFACLYASTGETSIRIILSTANPAHALIVTAAMLILVCAMIQSAIWPFHRWLLSSLNSPTPVSAMMHAGLVNGGGILIVRFAPLYFLQPQLLTAIFVIGFGTAFLASVWKLIQSDIKRMLACSTMAQMGFMLAQCGLGLFPAAVAHLCWHGLFKAKLFLTASSAEQEVRYDMGYPPSVYTMLFALLLGVYGSYIFSWASDQAWLPANSLLVLDLFVCIAITQVAIKLMQALSWKQVPIILAVLTLGSSIYGLSIYFIESMLLPMQLMHPQPLNAFHYVGMGIATVMWLAMIYKSDFFAAFGDEKLASWLYVKSLNASQPHPYTTTSYRHQYTYE